jgi:hypothetical protein
MISGEQPVDLAFAVDKHAVDRVQQPLVVFLHANGNFAPSRARLVLADSQDRLRPIFANVRSDETDRVRRHHASEEKRGGSDMPGEGL